MSTFRKYNLSLGLLLIGSIILYINTGTIYAADRLIIITGAFAIGFNLSYLIGSIKRKKNGKNNE